MVRDSNRRLKQSKTQKQVWRDKDLLETHSNIIKEAMSSREVRNKISERCKTSEKSILAKLGSKAVYTLIDKQTNKIIEDNILRNEMIYYHPTGNVSDRAAIGYCEYHYTVKCKGTISEIYTKEDIIKLHEMYTNEDVWFSEIQERL